MERKRELEQHRSQFSGVAQHVETGAGISFLFHGGVCLMSESLPKFGGEEELRVRRDSFDPLPAMFRL